MPSIELRRLPSFAEVGGNARHGNVGARVRAFQEEREAWRSLLNDLKAPKYQVALIDGPAELRITLHFRDNPRLNYDNVVTACKILVDLTEVPQVNFVNGRGGKKQAREKGWLGWVHDDIQYEWPWLISKRTHSPHGPLTVLEVAPL